MKQTFKFLTLSRVFNDCRDSVGRLSTLLLLLFALSFGFSSQAWADPTWMGNSYIVVNNTWYNGSGGGNKTPGNIGAITSLTLTGQIQTYGDNDGASHLVTMYYKIDDGSSQTISLTWQKYASNNNHFGYVDNKGVTPQTIDLSGLAAGSHTLAVWFNSSAGSLWDSNNGNNYNFSFTYNKTLSITYKDKGGSDFSGSHETNYPTTHTYGTATTLKTATKTGYTFDGWFTNSNCTGTAVTTLGATTYTTDITLYAKWTAKTYTVTLNPQGGTGGSASVTATYDAAMPSATMPTKTGYTFGGYYDGEGGTGTQYYNNTGASAHAWDKTSNTTLYAQWTENLTSVTISSNGNGTVSPTSASVGVTTTQSVTATPATGYHFVSWATTDNADIKGATTSNPVTLYGNGSGSTGTLTATFAETTYAIAVEAGDNGSVASNSVSAGQITSVALPTATPDDGYNFKNWTATDGITITNSTSASGATIIATKAGTVTANFESAATYSLTVSTNPAAAFTTSSGSEDDITLGQSYPISATLAEKGYTFTGWTADPAENASFGNKNDLSTTVTVNNGSVTVTANAEAIASNLTLKNNDGTDAEQVLVMHYNDASLPNTYEQPTRTGYNYSGYGVSTAANTTKIILQSNAFTTSSGETQSKWVTDGKWTRLTDGTLYACWTAHQKTFELNKNYTVGITKGYGEHGSGKITVGTKVAENYTPATRTAHRLLGYSIEDSGTTMVMDKDGNFIAGVAGYTDAEGNWIQDITDGTITKLYAQWQECMTTVTVTTANTDWGNLKIGGTNKSWGETVEVSKLKESYQLTATANTGYKFIEWVLADGAVLSTGALTDASIKVKGDSAHTTGTATAIFEEDLSSNWYLVGQGSTSFFPNGWDAGETNMMKRAAGHSTENVYYFTIHVNDEDIKSAGQESTYQFKIHHYKAGDGGCNDWFGWGNNQSNYWVNKTCTPDLYTGQNNLYFIPTIAGDYEFKVDATDGANVKLTVTWPIYNCVYGDFDSWNKDANKLNFGDGNEASTVVNITDISKSYEFLVLVNSNYLTNNASSTTPITRSTASEVIFAAKGGSDNNAKFTPDIAGDYTFTYNKSTNKLTITYPALPTASTTATEARIFNEEELSFIESGDGTDANPYKIYTDEALTIDITALAARSETGIVAKYQFGEEAATTDVLTKTITNPSTTKTSIVVKAFYESDGVAGTAWEKTIYYQGVSTPQLHLSASWYEKEENAVADNEQVTIYYRTSNYTAAATVTSQVDNAAAQPFMSITNETTKDANYQLPDKGLHRYTFTATATANNRTFTATTSVSVYRLVKITVTDATNLMDHYYMWIQDSNPIQYEQAWPGRTFYSKLGNAHIFYVKYPSYTHFVLNNGKNANEEGAAQTVDIAVPNQSTCYTIGEKITTEGADNGKYAVTPGDCPNKLFVGDIANVEMYNGEGKLVQPQVDTDPDLDVANLNVSVTFGTPNIVTYDQRGTGFMLTALSRGTTTATVTYSIAGATNETKTFNVTVGAAITIQAKIGINLGWSSHENIWIKYWGMDEEHNTQMKFVKYVEGDDGHDAAGQDYYTARLPMPDESSKIRFKIGYPNGTSWDDNWRNSDEVPDVDKSGCYTVYFKGNDQTRGISRDGDNCFVDYQVEIDMNSGITYFSNKVDNNTDIVSFFAPGSDKTGYEAGSVRIMKNGEQKASISAETFATSGVYTAKISGDGTGLADVALYKGDYYIRTDAAADADKDLGTGWDDYKKTSHKFTQFSLYPGAKYNYYWVRNNKRTSDETHFNVKGCVGNEYNPDLANMIAVNDYTDENGNIDQDKSNGVNLRFGYNPQTNYFERAILKGAGDNYFLNIQGDNVYNDEDCSTQVLNEANYNSHPAYSKFNDVSDWVYEKLIFAKIDGTYPSAKVVLKSKSFNNKIMYQLGYEVDEHGRATKTPIQKVVMGNGTEQGKYALRVIYDYKTNRLSATWEPSGEIDKVMQVDADILFVSNEGNDVKEITFTGDSTLARLTSLQSVMYVLEMENNDDDKKMTPDAQYWIALPFECKISDIFGIENYITLNENRIAQSGWWGIMRYRGDLRAQKGWFEEDTPEGFWEWMYPTETLMPGEGYVLYVEKSSLSWNSITVEEPCEEGDDGCVDGKKSVQKYVKRFYFPSLVEGFTMNRSGEASSKVTYPNQPCNITSPKDRRAEDSNWKVIAPKSYNNVSINSAEEQDQGHVLDEQLKFIYVYNEHAEKGSRYTATATAGFPFQAFHGYMAQYGGTITWNPYSKTEHPTSAPRFAEEPSFKGGMLTIELVQNNEQLDRTFVNLSKNGTEGFDQNLDLTKITESCAQIASISEDVLYAGNTLPLNIELVPLNVKVTANGTYDIALEQSLEGLEVRLYDAFEQTTTPLDLMSATVTLNKGEYKDRFFLQLKQKGSDTPTSFDGKLEQYNLPTDKTQKLLINGNIYLINAGRIYNATGTMVR